MLRIAVLGVGRIGRMHAENIAQHPRATLAGIYDAHPPAAHSVSELLNVTNFESSEAVFSSAEVDAVLIATSTPTHADYIEMAIAGGKPVLCEKPIDLSLERVNACASKIADSNVPIMLGFVRRFDIGHRGVRKAIEEGKIGDLHQVVITSRDPDIAPDSYIEVSGGIFRDMTIHDFDMARFILGEDITTVSATGSRLVSPALMERCDDYDTVSAVLTTASGKQCIINNSRRAVYGYDQRVEALGSLGMAISENRPMNHTRLYNAGFTDQAAPLLNFFIDRYDTAFAAEIDAFVDSIERGIAPEVGFEDGRQALILAEAAIRSAKESRTVNISEIG
ncbi:MULTISPECIES: inositol 2-dehydrogenase [Thalassospira]|uniref:Inositol 2-dehydrogenase n=2 Tax=Thalassospira TaxID=168934 RepID=A0ABR5Y5D5_9PROT|nr:MULTISPECIES: inositol 2-dehydrogenase [Thalassospira]KZD06148.1 inositol 2-dehydrogenase [Thalassospira xiamenensis]KZD07564.1 inositol 2-dehydrogenase [Thalassospira xiamenensis]OSQ35237.1 myo-inositol 2-dehydrogenase [Thalassospira sp. MCCC 1A01428]RCK41999.1 myo-inositol 2-dehydrogenase [Thalassospira profundimaris]|tara:strand:+ start:504 stop:1511 length:1008 start_codon:yes stop_codon:yes gene_type:complete